MVKIFVASNAKADNEDDGHDAVRTDTIAYYFIIWLADTQKKKAKPNCVENYELFFS